MQEQLLIRLQQSMDDEALWRIKRRNPREGGWLSLLHEGIGANPLNPTSLTPYPPSRSAADAHKAADKALRQGNFTEAHETCARLLAEIAPVWWDAHALHARILLERGKARGDTESIELSIDAFDTATRLLRASTGLGPLGVLPDDDRGSYARVAASLAEAELLNDRGVGLYELGEFDDAKAHFDATLSRSPGHNRALCNLGLVHWMQGRKPDALACFDLSVASPQSQTPNTHALNNRGALRLESGHPEAALPDFHAAISHDPGYQTALRNRDAALAELSEPVPLAPADEGAEGAF